ncbi:arsenicals resistance, partial [Teratosphaeriaceae sp. CCFEE 6253]
MDTIERGVADDPERDAGLGRIDDGGGTTKRGKAAKDIELTGADDENVHDTDEVAGPPPFKALSFLDKLLVLWIILSMAVGIILGNLIPSVGPALQKSTFVGVSGPIAAGLLVMMYPILCK